MYVNIYILYGASVYDISVSKYLYLEYSYNSDSFVIVTEHLFKHHSTFRDAPDPSQCCHLQVKWTLGVSETEGGKTAEKLKTDNRRNPEG